MSSSALVQCPECSKKLKVGQELLDGRKGRCPGCRSVFILRDAQVSSQSSTGTQAAAGTQGGTVARKAARPKRSSIQPSDEKPAQKRATAKIIRPNRGTGATRAYDYDLDDSADSPGAPPRRRKASDRNRSSKKVQDGPSTGRLFLVAGGAFLGVAAAAGIFYWLYQNAETVSPSLAQNEAAPTAGEGNSSVNVPAAVAGRATVNTSPTTAPSTTNVSGTQPNSNPANSRASKSKVPDQPGNVTSASSLAVAASPNGISQPAAGIGGPSGTESTAPEASGANSSPNGQKGENVGSTVASVDSTPSASADMKPSESPKPEPASKSANNKGNEIKLPPALAGISGSATTSEGNDWQRYLSDDKRLAFHAPPGKRTNRTLSLPGVLPWSKLESVEVGQNNGATFVSLIFTFPGSKRRELMNPEEFIENSLFKHPTADQQKHRFEAEAVPGQACPCYDVTKLNMDGSVPEDGKIETLRVYQIGLVCYVFTTLVPTTLDEPTKAAVAETASRFFDSVEITDVGKLAAERFAKQAARPVDANEALAAERMAALTTAIQKLPGQDFREGMSSIAAMMKQLETGQGNLPQLVLETQGRSNHSWRVQILPLIGHQELYNKFRLSEPWDSKHNKALLREMPDVFKCPGAKVKAGHTVYLKTQFPPPEPTSTKSGSQTTTTTTTTTTSTNLTSGGSDRITLLEVNPEFAVEWTRPEDFRIEAETLRKALGGIRKDGFLVNDGLFVDASIDDQTLLDLCTPGRKAQFP